MCNDFRAENQNLQSGVTLSSDTATVFGIPLTPCNPSLRGETVTAATS